MLESICAPVAESAPVTRHRGGRPLRYVNATLGRGHNYPRHYFRAASPFGPADSGHEFEITADKRAYEPPESGWSLPPMDTGKPRGAASTLPASWIRIWRKDESGDVKKSALPELTHSEQNAKKGGFYLTPISCEDVARAGAERRPAANHARAPGPAIHWMTSHDDEAATCM
ncbi:hypothetical protein EVAR_32869_1 [Eumeta japonica]|uniref:Uncharacterized protein n=1 Tax=Eumeta variegata TaxID=151549 RepID=A0A4C1VPK4_EUMVA|nr:hypothetical protein EVAR_32869_1 [Eumeta japonica]